MGTASPPEALLLSEIERLRTRVAELERERQVPETASPAEQRRHVEEPNQSQRENEALLRSFFDSAGVMRGFVDLIDGRIVHVSCNQVAANMYGLDR